MFAKRVSNSKKKISKQVTVKKHDRLSDLNKLLESIQIRNAKNAATLFQQLSYTKDFSIKNNSILYSAIQNNMDSLALQILDSVLNNKITNISPEFKKDGKNALDLAIEMKKSEISMKILDTKLFSTTDVFGKSENTSLMLAIYNGMNSVAKKLVEYYEANLHHVNKYGESALTLAINHNMENVAILIVQKDSSTSLYNTISRDKIYSLAEYKYMYDLIDALPKQEQSIKKVQPIDRQKNYKHPTNDFNYILEQMGTSLQNFLEQLNTNKTTSEHTIYLHVRMHGAVHKKKKVVIPKETLHITHILQGFLGCVNIVRCYECYERIPYVLSKGLMTLTSSEIYNTDFFTKRLKELNSGISSKEFLELYKKYNQPVDNIISENFENIKEYLPSNTTFIHSLQKKNRFDIYTYKKNQEGSLVYKTFSCKKKETSKIINGFTCLYASGGILSSYITQTINDLLCDSFIDNDEEHYGTSTNKLLKKLNSYGYTKIYIIDDSCNVYDNNNTFNKMTNQEILSSYSQLKKTRNKRMLLHSHTHLPV
jgi:hypothetical protein